MLEEVISYKEVLKTWILRELGESFFEENDWENAEIILEFLKVFYLATIVFFNIYIPSSHTTLHNIYEIAKYFAKYRIYSQLQKITTTLLFRSYFRS